MRKTKTLKIIAGVLLALAALFAFFAPQVEVFYGGGGWTPTIIIFGVFALAGLVLLTLGAFLNKKSLLIIGSSIMMAKRSATTLPVEAHHRPGRRRGELQMVQLLPGTVLLV